MFYCSLIKKNSFKNIPDYLQPLFQYGGTFGFCGTGRTDAMLSVLSLQSITISGRWQGYDMEQMLLNLLGRRRDETGCAHKGR
ncbi:MAG: hypothetical protein ACXVBH_10945 [Flavisolibacter sp.]